MTTDVTKTGIEEGLENEPKPHQAPESPKEELTNPEPAGDTKSKEGKRPIDNDNAAPLETLKNIVKTEGVEIDDAAEAAKVLEQEAPDTALSEDIKSLLEAIDLPEDFKTKAFTLFEAAVAGRIADIRTAMFATNESAMNTYKEELAVKLNEQVDQYLEVATAKWLEENQVAVKHGVRTQIAESFMAGLHALFESHNISVPEGKEDLVESLTAETETLKSQLAESVKTIVELTESKKQSDKLIALESVTKDLTDMQAARVKELAESVEFESVEAFTAKVNVIIEGLSGAPKDKPTGSVTEDVNGDAVPAVTVITEAPQLTYIEQLAKDMTRYNG